MPYSDRHPQKGLTLMEVLVVLVILALVSGLVLLRNPARSVELGKQLALRDLADKLAALRTTAIMQGRDQRDPVFGQDCDGNTKPLIVFKDGSTSGGQLCVFVGEVGFPAIIDPLTGYLALEQTK